MLAAGEGVDVTTVVEAVDVVVVTVAVGVWVGEFASMVASPR